MLLWVGQAEQERRENYRYKTTAPYVDTKLDDILTDRAKNLNFKG